MADESTVVAGALGAVLGYLGGEVAEESLFFERLLWPQRYFNDWSLSIAAKQCLFLTMGGPIHSAALKTLDMFRTNKLYYGRLQGHMLGTAFYPDSKVTYVISPDDSLNRSTNNAKSSAVDKDARNAFWVEVSRQAQRTKRYDGDIETGESRRQKIRALHSIHHLILTTEDTRPDRPRAQGNDHGDQEMLPPVPVSEHEITWKVVLGLLCSETVSIIAAIVLAIRSDWGMFAYMLIPLILKYMALLASPDRDGLGSEAELIKAELKFKKAAQPVNNDTPPPVDQEDSLGPICMFEISDPEQDFFILEGSRPVVYQFFHHYGHPERSSPRSRIREVVCIAVVYVFVVYFPAGLLINVFMDSDVQYLWLAYQLYTVLAMHILRLAGWQGCGRTEERVADILSGGRRVQLQSPTGGPVIASLTQSIEKTAELAKTNVQGMLRKVLFNEEVKEMETSSSDNPPSSQDQDQGERV